MPSDRFNAFLQYPEVSVSNAKTGALAGMTLGVKDIFGVAGYPSGWGNPFRAQEAPIAFETAPAVQKLLDAGARFVGKTQTDELAFSLMGQNSHYPYPVNPRAPDRITGGSSSGSAAAVAGGLVDIATGSDTGGSIRAPASFCGLIGLRATHGAISLDKTMPLARSFDTFGWFAKDVATYNKVAQVLLGDAATAETGFGRVLRSPLLESLLLPEAREEYARMADGISGMTGSPTPMPAPSLSIDELYWCFRRIQSFEAWQAHGEWLSVSDRKLGPGVIDRFAFGRSIEPSLAEFERTRLNEFRQWLMDQLGDDGLLILPTVPSAAPKIAQPFEKLQEYREQAIRMLAWSGLSGLPQLTLPIGAIGGAPFGISVLGPAGSDLALLHLGERVLRAVGGQLWTH